MKVSINETAELIDDDQNEQTKLHDDRRCSYKDDEHNENASQTGKHDIESNEVTSIDDDT